MSDEFKKYLSEEYGDLADDLYEMGVNNHFKLKTIEDLDLNNLNENSVIKLSYVNYGEKFLYPEFDIKKWNIANAHLEKLKRVNYSEKHYDSILKKFFQDKNELNSFMSWSRNKMDNQKKYSQKKEAAYTSGIVPGVKYHSSLPGSSFGEYSDISDLYRSSKKPKDEGTMMVDRARQIKEELSAKKNKTKSSANRYLKGLAALLQSSDDISWEVYSEAMDCVVKLMKVFKKSYGKTIQASAAHRTANAFDNLGLVKHASDIRKIAQELEQPEAAPQQVQQPAEETQQQPAAQQPAEQTQNQEGQPQPERAKEEDFRIPESEPVDIRTIQTPGPSEGDYNKFMTDDVTVDDATMKLDAVASMLADRRVIRMLAEFDIMLDKLGIASMFPELAESQSKLIDAFSYALTRVSKMMGQLSNAKELIQAAKNLPGQEEPDQVEPNQAEQLEQGGPAVPPDEEGA